MFKKQIVLGLVLATLTLAGCNPAPTSAVIDTSTLSFRPIPVDRRDTCATQKEVAAHNSVYDTLKSGKEVAYCAPCECAGRYKRRKKAPAKLRPKKKAEAVSS